MNNPIPVSHRPGDLEGNTIGFCLGKEVIESLKELPKSLGEINACGRSIR